MPKLLLSLKAPPPGVQIFMNDGNANALVGIATPVDFGSYTIVAGAPGHAAFRKTVDVKVEGNVVTVEIELVPAKSGRP